MKALTLGRCAFSLGAAVVLLSGCGTAQLPTLGPSSSGASRLLNPREQASSEKLLYSFAGGADGSYPQAAPISIKGEFYGTTILGGDGGCSGVNGCGTVYKVDAAGKERVLHVFTGGRDGEAPAGSLIDVNGNLLGTTRYGGGHGCKSTYTTGCGTVFELSPSGKERVIYSFPGGAQGAQPDSQLVRYKDEFYGEAAAGGTGKCYYAQTPGCGLIFKMSPSGRVSIVYTFKGDKDAGTPQGGLLFYKGNFYGTSSAGGSYACYFSYGCGTVFEISPSGHETILHVFQGAWTDGALPQAGLVALNGVLYGTTLSGGSMNCGLTYYLPCGTVFAVTLSGHEKIIHNFAGGTDGAYPNQLTVVGGTLYGTTEIGGAGCNDGFGCGTVFALTPSGQETIVHSFAGTPEDGDDPTSAPIEAGGTLYGTTAAGGTSSDGTLYALRP